MSLETREHERFPYTTVTVLIDSADRDTVAYANSSSFVVKLPETLRFVRKAAVTSMEVPAPINANVPYIILNVPEIGRMVEGVSNSAATSSSRFPLAKLQLGNTINGYHLQQIVVPLFSDVHPEINRLDRLTCSWRTHDGTLVNFNGNNWSATIQFVCQPDTRRY
jgi:hypothetical protein